MQETIEAVRNSFQADLDSFPTDQHEIDALRSKYFGIVMESNIHFAWSLLFSGLLILMPYIRLRLLTVV